MARKRKLTRDTGEIQRPSRHFRSHPDLKIDMSTVNPQQQSPLFKRLPPELRNYVFELALEQSEDPSVPYPPEHFCYRPGYRAKRRVFLDLLRTCRAVYAETKHIPLSEGYEHTVWCGDQERAPPDNTIQQSPEVYSTSLPARGPLQGDAVEREVEGPLRHNRQEQEQAPAGRLHVFAQMWWLENLWLSTLLESSMIRLRTVVLTIRHTDWWYWERDEPLRLEQEVFKELRLPETVREFDLELETVERKKGQLDAIVAQAKLWRIQRSDMAELSAVNRAPKVCRWTGTLNFYSESNTQIPGLAYYVVTLEWRLATASA